jgi:hypothetical protein
VQVINTVKPGYFQQEITKALVDRKNKQALTQNKFISMNEEMLSLITNSNHVSTGKFSRSDPCFSNSRQGTQSLTGCFEKEEARTSRIGTRGV